MSKTIHAECPRCGIEATLKDRQFSNQAVAALIAWGELPTELAGAEICSECYSELRDILVERTDEVAISKVG